MAAVGGLVGGADRKWDDGAGIKQALGQAGRGLRGIGARLWKWTKPRQGCPKMITERPETRVDTGILSMRAGTRGEDVAGCADVAGKRQGKG